MFKKLKEAFKSFTQSILSIFRGEEKEEEERKPQSIAQSSVSQEVTVEIRPQETRSETAATITKPEVEVVEKRVVEEITPTQKPAPKIEEKKPGFFARLAQRVTETIAYTKLSEDKVAKLCESLFVKLVECDVAVEVSELIAENVKQELLSLRIPRFGTDKESIVKEAIKRALLRTIEDVPDVDFVELVKKIHEERSPVVLLFLGPNGYGKTTTIAKIGYLLQRLGYSVVFAAADTFRAGAIEQLEEHGRRLGIRVIKHRYGADPAAVVHDAIAHAEAKGIDFVLIDTAGRMHTDVNLMDELRKIYRVAEPDLSIFVADALLGNEALEVAKTYSKYVNIDGLVITKVDAYPKGGSILTFLVVLKKPIYFLGTGQRYEDLVPFKKEWFISQLLE